MQLNNIVWDEIGEACDRILARLNELGRFLVIGCQKEGMIIDGIVDEHEAAKKQDDMMIDYGKITFHISRIVPHRYGIIDDRFHNLKDLQYNVHSLNSI